MGIFQNIENSSGTMCTLFMYTMTMQASFLDDDIHVSLDDKVHSRFVLVCPIRGQVETYHILHVKF